MVVCHVDAFQCQLSCWLYILRSGHNNIVSSLRYHNVTIVSGLSICCKVLRSTTHGCYYLKINKLGAVERRAVEQQVLRSIHG